MREPKTSEHDENAIKKLGEEYFQAANTGNVEQCIATMAPDVVIMPPNRASIVGIEQLRCLSRDYHAVYEVKYSLVFDEVEVAGDVAFARATATGTRRHRSEANVERVAWRNVWILKRQRDNTWKFWRIIFNSTVPLEP
jgi:ketosteroid isomerase-like protein